MQFCFDKLYDPKISPLVYRLILQNIFIPEIKKSIDKLIFASMKIQTTKDIKGIVDILEHELNDWKEKEIVELLKFAYNGIFQQAMVKVYQIKFGYTMTNRKMFKIDKDDIIIRERKYMNEISIGGCVLTEFLDKEFDDSKLSEIIFVYILSDPERIYEDYCYTLSNIVASSLSPIEGFEYYYNLTLEVIRSKNVYDIEKIIEKYILVEVSKLWFDKYWLISSAMRGSMHMLFAKLYEHKGGDMSVSKLTMICIGNKIYLDLLEFIAKRKRFKDAEAMIRYYESK